jgi:Tn3 transposase DDE domain
MKQPVCETRDARPLRRFHPGVYNFRMPDLLSSLPFPDTAYEHIDSLCRQSIDWTLIERRYPDMMRVAVSIKAGKTTPSTILRRRRRHRRKLPARAAQGDQVQPPRREHGDPVQRAMDVAQAERTAAEGASGRRRCSQGAVAIPARAPQPAWRLSTGFPAPCAVARSDHRFFIKIGRLGRDAADFCESRPPLL